MSYLALYRKYRPRSFAQVADQKAVVQALRNQVATGHISHAYLFSGPRGTGKTSLAKILARTINCLQPQQGEACGVCEVCTALAQENNLDIVEIDAASNNSVDKVREMLDNVKFLPGAGRYRVYIIDEVHMLSTSAFNALLKTLEEPPAHVVFILATTEAHKLPATVLSRCQQYRFGRIEGEQMRAALRTVLQSENAVIEDEALDMVVQAASGSMRDALSLLDQCLAVSADLHVRADTLRFLLGSAGDDVYLAFGDALLAGDTAQCLQLLQEQLLQGSELRTFAADVSRHLRDLYICAEVADARPLLETSQARYDQLKASARKHAPGDILEAIALFGALEGELRYSLNARLVCELAIFRAARRVQSQDDTALLTRIERLEAAQRTGTPPAAQPEQPSAQTAPAEPAPKPASPTTEPDAYPPLGDYEPPADYDLPADDADAYDPSDYDQPTRRAPRPPEPAPRPRPRAPQPEPQAQQPLPQAQPPAAAQAQDAAALWQSACAVAPPQVALFMRKGTGDHLEGSTLFVRFAPEAEGNMNMLSNPARLSQAAQAVSAAAGTTMQVKLRRHDWTADQQDFISQSLAALGDAFQIEIEGG